MLTLVLWLEVLTAVVALEVLVLPEVVRLVLWGLVAAGACLALLSTTELLRGGRA
ncbi:hypothetical protein [Deinococcus indicus]|uniref:hypothetical protein n=1 Tax=Deinococcus indicus TaxID=223556 RepID=UPI0015555ACF|nr:hypothetical protein [Deinococcus indicus]